MAENTEGQVNPEQPDIIEDNRAANAISSMLWVWKWVNRDTLNKTFDNQIVITLPTFGPKYVGGFLDTSGATITNVIKTYRFAYFAGNNNSGGKIRIAGSGLSFENKYKDIDEFYPKEEAKARRQAKYESLVKNLTVGDKDGREWDTVSGQVYWISIEYFLLPTKKIESESPIKNFEDDDAFYINTEPTSYYLRFGALLDYIADEIIPKINTENPEYYSNPPMFKIDRDKYSNFMYSLPNQLSLDPRVCIVRNDKFQRVGGIASIFSSLLPFRNPDFTTIEGYINPNKAYPMNIYLNFEFIIDSLNSNADEKGDINLYNFLKTVCDGLNKSLGGINNLEPIMDEETNTLRIIDTTPIPGVKENKKYTLQLYGYNKTDNGYISNFVRKVDLKTSITPEFATMVTVGATAGGYVKGTEGTAFSKWNTGLTDRFKEEFIPGNESSHTTAGQVNEAVTNYTDKFLANAKHTTCYGYTGNLLSEDIEKNLKISSDIIEGNLSVVTEYYKYLIASQKDQQGGTIGFIPFKLSFTMDGLSGIKIYNTLNVDTRFLPKAYGDNLDLIVTGVSHRLANNDWETDIETTVIPKTNQLTDLVISEEAVAATIKQGVANQQVTKPSSKNPNPSGYGDQYGVCGSPEKYDVSKINPNSAVNGSQAKILLNKVIQKVVLDTNGASRSVCAAYVKRIVKKYFEYYNKPTVKISNVGSWNQSSVSVGGLHAKNKSTHDWLISSFGYKRIALGKNLSTSEVKSLINSVNYNIGDVVSYWDHSGSDKGKQKYGHIQIYEGNGSWRSDFKHGSFVYGAGAGCWDIIYLQAPNKKEPKIEN